MATIPTEKEVTPFKIDKFLGLNISKTGDTQIKDGESGNMDNFYITNDYKLKKMYGYKKVYDFETRVRGSFVCNINNENSLLIAAKGHLYKVTELDLNNEDGWSEIVPEDLGTLTDDDTSFFVFGNKVYILNGHEYKVWDGKELKDVEGYIPKVYISTKPDGSGTEFEQINLLTGKKHQTFNGDGTSKTFKLAEKNITSVDKVIVDTVEMESTKYSVDLSQGTVTFSGDAPKEAMDNVDIYWDNTNQKDRHFIENMRAGILFGGNVDTKVFLYGNENEQNRIRYSATANNLPSVEYFPGVNQIDVGASNFAVTDLRRHYDRLLVTTNKPDAYYIAIDTLDIEGVTTTSLQTLPLNEVYGNVAFAQGQVINNDPITIGNNEIIKWHSTNVRDERNMEIISEKIQLDLIDLDLKSAKTFDYQTQNQYWLSSRNKIYIYNYVNETYSRITLIEDMDMFTEIGGYVFSITNQGKLVKWGEEYQTFDGDKIKAHWEMNFANFGAEYLRKTMNKLWVLMQPQASSSVEVGYISNRNESPIMKRIEYKLSVLDDVDFSDFSFSVSNNPQPFRLKLKAKKFTNLKIILDNNEETDSTILALDLKVEAGGESK